MKQRMEALEHSILDLGTQLFQIKSEMVSVRSSHKNIVDIIKGLKLLLDDKGVINSEDFENAIDLGQALTLNTAHDSLYDADMTRLKKSSH